MIDLNPDLVRALASHETGPKTSLLMPVHPGSSKVREDPIRLKTLLGHARRALEAQGVRLPDRLLEPVAEHLSDGSFWQSAGQGLVAWVAPDLHRVLRVPVRLPEVCEVSDGFHLKPLLPLVTGGEVFYVLAASEKEVRLLRCTRRQVERVELDRDVSFARVEGMVESGQRSRHAYAAASGRGTSTRGQGFGHEDRRKHRLDEWFSLVSDAVQSALAGQSAPLVFVGIDGYYPRYAARNDHPHLLDESVVVNADEVDDEEARDRALALAEPVLMEPRRRDAERLGALRGSERAVDAVEAVVRAARNGRIEALFVAVDAHRWGRVEDEEVEVHEAPEPGDRDLLDEAAVRALLSGARVHAVPAAELPGASPAEAILRW